MLRLPVLPDDEFGSWVDSTGKRVVCLKGFEDDGSDRRIRVVRIRKRRPVRVCYRIFDNKVERASREKSFELSSSDLT